MLYKLGIRKLKCSIDSHIYPTMLPLNLGLFKTCDSLCEKHVLLVQCVEDLSAHIGWKYQKSCPEGIKIQIE